MQIDSALLLVTVPQRAYSITTRIKTPYFLADALDNIILKEHIPLQQGLRHITVLAVRPTTVSRSKSIFHYNKD